eukprot:3227777-Rhodomonas_salina.7
MRKLFFWGCRTDSTDCTSAVVAMSGEMALPGYPGAEDTNVIPFARPGPPARFAPSSLSTDSHKVNPQQQPRWRSSRAYSPHE